MTTPISKQECYICRRWAKSRSCARARVRVACALCPTVHSHDHRLPKHSSPRFARHKRYAPTWILSLSRPDKLNIGNTVFVTIPTLKLSRPSLPTAAFRGTRCCRGHFSGLCPVRPKLSTQSPHTSPLTSATYVSKASKLESTRSQGVQGAAARHIATAQRDAAISHTHTHAQTRGPLVESRPPLTLSGFTAPFLVLYCTCSYARNTDMASHRLSVPIRQDRLSPRSPGSPRSPRFPRRVSARVQRGYRRRAFLASCFSLRRHSLSFLADDLFKSILHRAPSLIPRYPFHALQAMNMDSEDGEMFVKVRARQA